MKHIGEQSKRAAVVIGRFNPPTIGHYAIFDKMKKVILSRPELNLEAVPIVIVVQGEKTSMDKDANPLTGHERVSFMQASGRADGVKFLISKSAHAGLMDVRAAGFEPILIGAGSDRADGYLALLDKYFKTDTGDTIKHELVKFERENADSLGDILRYTDSEIPLYLVSASLARMAARNKEFDKFSILTGLTKKPKLARKMYNRIIATGGANGVT